MMTTSRGLADILSGEINLLTGLKLSVAHGAARAGDIVLAINGNLKAGEDILRVKAREVVRTREGAYRLTVGNQMKTVGNQMKTVGNQVKVEGFDYRAVAEGTATLLQAITREGSGFVVPAMTIDDWPHADYTGAMVDVARQDNPMSYLRQMVDTCRVYKVRYLQLHMTDDQAWTFPSTAFPKLGTLNGSAHGGPRCEVYKLDELKALVKYADERGVTLVPELETPGHCTFLCNRLPEFFGKGQAMDVSMPNIYQALDNMVRELSADRTRTETGRHSHRKNAAGKSGPCRTGTCR